MRALLLTLVCTSLVWTSTAFADVLPEPERPEFEHTPLPMPDVPTGVMLVVVAAVLVGGAIVWWKRRDQEA